MIREEQKLDNPVWYSLAETHHDLAINYEDIKFYHPDFCPFGGFTKQDQTLAGIDQYAVLTNNFYVVGDQPDLSNQLQIKKELICNQMLLGSAIDIPLKEEVIELGKEHRNDLFELVNLVQPGYFKTNTYQMGRYYGIYLIGKLVAVAGERMKMKSYTEISAVVTHPGHTGKGYAKQLIAHASKQIFNENKTPYLHVVENNITAVNLYLKLGFKIRRKISFWNIVALLLLLISSIFTANAQSIKNGNLVIGKVDSMHSKILNENRKVWIYLPSSARETKYQKQHYPVLYLLDAESHFTSVTAMIQQLSEVNGNSVLPEMIVVGIPNKDRTRDLTPTNALTGPEGKTYKMFEKSGGGEKFAAFIEKELMPHIDSLYAPSPQRAIIGHSFGGLTIMNIMINHPKLFSHYVAIDPSMWWDRRKLLNETKAAMADKNFDHKSLFVGIANTMTIGMDTTNVISDTSGDTEHIRAILALNKIIKSRPANGLQYASKYYNEDNHGSVPLIAEYDALHFLYEGFGLSQGEMYALSDPKSNINIESFITGHYQKFSKKSGVTTLPPEPYINQTALYLLSDNLPERAYALLSLNISNYPKSFSAYNSMGNYYNSRSDQKKAIEYYLKALALQENPETRATLKKLTANKPK